MSNTKFYRLTTAVECPIERVFLPWACMSQHIEKWQPFKVSHDQFYREQRSFLCYLSSEACASSFVKTLLDKPCSTALEFFV